MQKRITACRLALIPVILFSVFLSACSENVNQDVQEEVVSVQEEYGVSVLPGMSISNRGPEKHGEGETSVIYNDLPEYSSKVHIDLCSIGDVMAHNGTYEAAYKNGTYDFDYMFADIAKYVIDSDYSIGNLETVFAGKAAA